MWNLLKKHPKEMLYATMLAFYGGLGQTYLIAYFNQGIETDLNITNIQNSYAYSLATFIASFTLPFFGKVIDKNPSQKIGWLLGLGLMMGFFSLSNTTSVFFLFISYFLIRSFGQVAIGLLGSSFIARYFGKHRGKALSFTGLGRTICHGTLPLLVAYFMANHSWTTAIYFILILILIYFFLVTLLGRGLTTQSLYIENIDVVDKFKKLSPSQVYRRPFIYLLTFCNALVPYIMTGVFFHQMTVRQNTGWSLQLWSQGFTVFAASQFITGLMGGYLVDSYTARRVLPLILIPLLLGFCLIIFNTDSLACLVFMGLAGASVGLGSNIKSSFIGECFNEDYIGLFKSIDSAFMVISTSLAPIIFSYTFTVLGFRSMLNISIVSILVGIVIYTYCSLIIKKDN
jgi:MFS family permease